MALILLPSLEHIAAVKVALTVYNDDIAHFLGEFIESYKDDSGTSFNINKRQEERIRERKTEMRLKLLTRLSEPLVDRVVRILQPIVAEVYFWVRDHFYVIKHIQKSHIIDSLCWKSEGTIDIVKTSNQLIQNQSIDIRVRFVFSCLHFYEEEVSQLWQSMRAEERANIYSFDVNLSVGFWLGRLRRNDASPWMQCIATYLKAVRPGGFHPRHRRLRISSFFSELDISDKGNILQNLWPRHAYFDDLRICYYLTPETERPEVFLCPLLFESKTKHLLSSYINWPLQTLFLDLVNQMWDYLTPDCLEHLLCYIVEEKLSKSMEDFDYLNLFKDLWNRIPDSCKIHFRRLTLIFALRLLSYNKTSANFSIAETLENCRHSIIADSYILR